MNSLFSLLNGAPAWFTALLNLSLQASLLAGIVWLIVKALGRWIPPSWRALLWFIVMARILIPFAPPSSLSLQNLFVRPEPMPAPVHAERKITFPPVNRAAPAEFVSEPAFDPIVVPAAPAPFPPGRALAIAWFCGAFAGLFLLIGRYLFVRVRLARHGARPAAPILEMLAACRDALRLRYPIRVTASDEIAAPALTGLLPARLIIPKSFATAEFTSEQIRHILLHELAHVQLGHLLLHWLTLIARALHWFNPVVHFAATRLRQECELAADAVVLRNSTKAERAAYGETLLQVLSFSTAPASALALGMAEQRRHLEQRLRALAEPPKRSFRMLGAMLAVAIAVAGLSRAVDPAPPVVADATPAAATPLSQFDSAPEFIPRAVRLEVRSIEAPPGTIFTLLEKNAINPPTFTTAPHQTNFALNAQQTVAIQNALSNPGGFEASILAADLQAESKTEIRFGDEPDIPNWPPGTTAPPNVEALFAPTLDPLQIKLQATIFMCEFLGMQSEDTNAALPHFRIRSMKSDELISIGASRAFFLPPGKRIALKPLSFTSPEPLRWPLGGGGAESEMLVILTPRLLETSPAPAAVEKGNEDASLGQIRKLIAEAGQAVAQGDRATAIRKYETAWALVRSITGADVERAEIQAELPPIRLALAKKAQEVGDIAEADTQIKAALRINPDDETARKAKIELDNQKSGAAQRSSAKETVAASKVLQDALIQDARLLIEMGKLDEAEKKLRDVVKANPENQAAFYYLNLIKEQKYSRDINNRLGKTWNEPLSRATTPVFGNPFARTNQIQTSPQRQNLYRKLESIRIEEFPLNQGTDLVEVLKELGREIKMRDPSGRGVNFLISPSANHPVQILGSGEIDPLTGLPVATTPNPDLDVEKFKIKFDPPIRDVTLGQFLDAIVMVARPPDFAPANAAIKYSVEDYAIVFSQKTPEAERYFTRRFRVDSNAFRRGLEGVQFSANSFQGSSKQGVESGGPGGFFTFGGGINGPSQGINQVTTLTNTSLIMAEIRAFLSAAGVDFPTNAPSQFGPVTPPTKALFFNERAGILFARAPLSELDVIEQALHTLNEAPAKGPPQVQFEAQVFDVSADEALRFTRELGEGRAIQTTNEYLFATLAKANEGSAQLSETKKLAENLKGSFIARNIVSESSEFILSKARAADLKAGLKQRAIFMPTLTTVVGRQAIISIEDAKTVVTGNPKKIESFQIAVGHSIHFDTQSFDGERLQYAANYVKPEFLGYMEGTKTPLPRMRVRSTGALTKLPLGSTQLFVIPQQDLKRLPVLGDLPLLGRLFESQGDIGAARRFVVFITPTIVDSSGEK